MRLVGGVSPYEGRVELCASARWGTVCDDFWDSDNTNVVCRQLNLTSSSYTGKISPLHSLILNQHDC